MKSKGSPNLYEILKSSESESTKSAPGGPVVHEAGGGAASSSVATEIKEAPGVVESIRVAVAEPPRQVRLTEVEPAVTTREETPPASTPKPRVMVMRPPAPPVSEEKEVSHPGDRTVTLTYNTTGFLILVALGLLFISYSLGVRKGRKEGGGIAVAVPELPGTSPAALPAEPSPKPEVVYSIKLLEWAATSDQDRVKNMSLPQIHKETLERRGLKEAWYQMETRGEKKFWVLYYGRYKESEEMKAREMLSQLREFKVKGSNGKTSIPYEQCGAVRPGE